MNSKVNSLLWSRYTPHFIILLYGDIKYSSKEDQMKM